MRKVFPIKVFGIEINGKVLIISGLALLFLLITISVVVSNIRNRIHDLPTILDSGRLAVLTDSSRMGFSTKGDSVFGFQYEIVKAFADTLGLELVITEESDLKSCMENLKGGDYDIIANFVPVTNEWKNEALFAKPLFTSHQVLVQRLGNDSLNIKQLKKQLELANDTVYIPLNSPYKMRLENLSNEIAAPIHIVEIKNKSAEQLVHMVSSGEIKYTICDEQFAKQLKLQYPTIDVSLPISFEQKLAWVVHKDSPQLLQELNDFLEDFIGSEAYWKIYRKYY